MGVTINDLPVPVVSWVGPFGALGAVAWVAPFGSIGAVSLIRVVVVSAGGATYLATESGQFLTTEDGQNIIIQ